MADIERILAEARMNVTRGRAIATGIGLFGLVVRPMENGDLSVLLRRRLETDSIYQQDLSGKWELTGGGVRTGALRRYYPGGLPRSD